MADFNTNVIEPIGALIQSKKFGGKYKMTLLTKSGVNLKFLNRVYDESISNFVIWITLSEPDIYGIKYPGPGEFGSDTRDYVNSIL